MSELAQWLVACALVIMYANQRFNTPVTNTYSTTAVRYYTALVLYVSTIGVIFVFLGGGISVSPTLLKMFTVGGADLPPGIEELPGPLLAALLLTTLMPNSPILSRFDVWLRRSAWRIGKIPREAHRLSAQMRQSQLMVPDDYRKTVANRMAGFGVTVDDLERLSDSEAESDLVRLLVQVTYLEALTRDWRYNEVRNWLDKKYDKVVAKLVDDYRATRVDYERLMSAALEHFKALQASGRDMPAPLQRRLAAGLMEKAEALNRDLCDFVARGILRREGTQAERYERLRSVGFVDIAQSSQPISFNDVVGVCLGVFFILFFPMLGLVVWGSSGGRVSQAFMIPFMVAIIYGFAIFAAIYPKTTWSFANIRMQKRRPIVAYLLSGFLAMMFGSVISMVFRFLGTGGSPDFIKALESVWWSHPWFVMSFVTATTLAWLTDNYALGGKRPSVASRIGEAAVMAIILAVAAYIVHLRLTEIHTLGMNGTFPWWLVHREVPEWFSVRPLEFLLPITAGVGLLLGYTVPHLYRSASGDEEAESADDDKLTSLARTDTAVNV